MSKLTSVEAVQAYLGLPAHTEEELAPIVAAVTALIESYHGARDPWPSNLQLGATMLAGRIYRRRNSPAGVESLGELGPVYVSRNDPDLAQLLKIGRYAEPRVG